MKNAVSWLIVDQFAKFMDLFRPEFFEIVVKHSISLVKTLFMGRNFEQAQKHHYLTILDIP